MEFVVERWLIWLKPILFVADAGILDPYQWRALDTMKWDTLVVFLLKSVFSWNDLIQGSGEYKFTSDTTQNGTFKTSYRRKEVLHTSVIFNAIVNWIKQKHFG